MQSHLCHMAIWKSKFVNVRLNSGLYAHSLANHSVLDVFARFGACPLRLCQRVDVDCWQSCPHASQALD